MYQTGDSVLITDIGEVTPHGDPGLSLVCVTGNVNTQCCKGRDGPNGRGGRVGEWYSPTGAIVPPYSTMPPPNFSRSGFTHEVRLNRRNNALESTGTYECRVPHESSTELVNASIILIMKGQCLFRNVYVTVSKENL